MHCYAVGGRENDPSAGELLVFENDAGCVRGDRYARDRELEDPGASWFAFEEECRIEDAVPVEDELHDLRLTLRVRGSAMGATATEAERRFLDALRSLVDDARRRTGGRITVDGIEPA